jgi:hypothetical protein
MNHEEKQQPNWALLWTIAGVLVALVLGFVGLLYQSGRILPQSPTPTPPTPTATPNVTPITFARIACLADNSIDSEFAVAP